MKLRGDPICGCLLILDKLPHVSLYLGPEKLVFLIKMSAKCWYRGMDTLFMGDRWSPKLWKNVHPIKFGGSLPSKGASSFKTSMIRNGLIYHGSQILLIGFFLCVLAKSLRCSYSPLDRLTVNNVYSQGKRSGQCSGHHTVRTLLCGVHGRERVVGEKLSCLNKLK